MTTKDNPSCYLAALEHAWLELIDWIKTNRFNPSNEECVQSFLYRGIVNHLGTAVGVHPKPTRGKLSDKEMHFPDFILGDPPQVVVEIKFARNGKSILASCKQDIRKMLTYYGKDDIHRVFILFDANPSFVFLNNKRKASLLSDDPSCRLMHYPEELNPIRSSPADKAHLTIKAKKVRALSVKKKLVQQGCLPNQTLDQIRQEIREAFPGTTDAELESLGC